MRIEKFNELYGYIEDLRVNKKKFLEIGGKFLAIERHLVQLNNGYVLTREKLVKNGIDGSASIVLPMTSEGNVLLVVQPRVFTKEGVSVELVAGYVDAKETYEEAAKRELFEETGYVFGKLTWLGSFYQDQGCSAAYNQAFLAEDCRKISEQHLDGDEFIKIFECRYDEMLELVDMGIINDCQSLLTIERSKRYLKKRILY